ncbi:MAG: RIP metalloprotease RseP [Burkholderiaceae bacterium]
MNSLMSFLFAVALLVFVHEMGHYLAARSVGVHVERFSVGFGRTILRLRDRRGCEWAVGWIPLGGYVKMWDAGSGEARPADAAPTSSFHAKPLWARSWVVVAGPLANFLFAWVAFSMVASLPRQEPVPVMAVPAAQSPAAQAGLRGGETISAVGGVPVLSFSDVRWQLFRSSIAGDNSVLLTVSPEGGAAREVRVALVPSAQPDQAVSGLGLAPGSLGVRLTGVQPDGPGATAGLQPDMVVLSVDGEPIRQPMELVARVREAQGAPMVLGVVQTQPNAPEEEVPGSGRLITVTAQPGADGVHRLGVGIGAQTPMVTVDRDAVDAVVRGVRRTVDVTQVSLQALWRMLTGDLSWRQLNGPVAIADAAGQSAAIGWTAFIGFLALVSVSIGILNLLPIPMLDGGHLLYYFFEFLRGKPLPDRVQAVGQRVGLMLVLGLTGLALFNDVSRFFGL